MKAPLQIFRLLSIVCCLLLTQGLSAQDTLDLLIKLDKGLPPSGLNASGLGAIIACIGDVNNDGFDDWAVGSPDAADYETGVNVGKVYLYFGGQSIQNNKNPDLILSGDESSFGFGRHIAPAGDVNNDGYSDFLVSINHQVALFFGGVPLDLIADIIFNPDTETGSFGSCISSAGDVNNDGFDDVIISSQKGVCIFLGGIQMNSQPAVILEGEQERDWYGNSVAPAGDVNTDGFDDVIIGAPGYSLNGYDVGRAYVYYGGAPMDTIADLVMTGEHAGDFFGNTVSGAGDLNNDGYADVLVGTNHYENINSGDGRVYIYYGGISNELLADVLINGRNGKAAGDINKDGFDDLLINQSVYWGGNLMDSIPDFNFANGTYLAGKGDYNNDGYADIIAGQPFDDTNGEDAGSVSLFFGNSQLRSTADVVFYGEPSFDHFGSSVSPAGDLNKDGYDDFIIGVPGYNHPSIGVGCVNVYFGGNTIKNEPGLILTGKNASFAGDVNADGFDDIIVGNSAELKANLYLGGKVMDQVEDFTFMRGNSSSGFGNSVSYAGDFNKDGFDDIVVGDYCNYAKGIHTGRAYIYFGGMSMNTNPDLTFEGEEEFNNFGTTGTFAGDVNNDGFPDIMIGAPGYDRTNLLGRLYIYYGGTSPDTIPDVVITGNKHYRKLGSSIASAGDVNNDGYDDIIAGLPHFGNNPYGLSYVNIYFGGAEMDTIPDVIFEKMAYGFGGGVSSAGDLNNDGYDDVMIGGEANVTIYYGGLAMDTIPDVIIKGENSWWIEFGSSLAFVGDVNKDNHTDFLIGNPYSNATGNQMGRAFIYSSKIINTGLEALKQNLHNQVYPNPFTTETTIQYSIQKTGRVMIKIFNPSGQEIETLVNASHVTGEYRITWHPKGLPNGMYFCKIQSPGGSETKKIILHR